jgi:hypothetical protein
VRQTALSRLFFGRREKGRSDSVPAKARLDGHVRDESLIEQRHLIGKPVEQEQKADATLSILGDQRNVRLRVDKAPTLDITERRPSSFTKSRSSAAAAPARALRRTSIFTNGGTRDR